MSFKVSRPHLTEIRDKNKVAILGMLRSGAAISRPDIAESLNLSLMSVSRLVKELVTEGICRSDGDINSNRMLGRRPSFVSLNTDYGWVVAVCLSAFSKEISIIDIAGNKRYGASIPEDESKTPEGAAHFIGKTVKSFLSMNQNTAGELLGCAVVVAGQFDVKSGVLLSAPLLNWSGINIQKLIEEELPCEVVVDNIANALCISHVDNIQIRTAQTPNIMLVHVAAGMGASLFVNNQLVRRGGDEGWTGQIKIQSSKCKPGQKLSLAEVVSGRALIDNLAKHKNFEIDKGKDFASNFKRAIDETNSGNKDFSEVFGNAGATLGKNLFVLSAGSQPDFLVLAGPAFNATSYEKGVCEGFGQESLDANQRWTSIQVSRHSYLDAAESMALRKFFFRVQNSSTLQTSQQSIR